MNITRHTNGKVLALFLGVLLMSCYSRVSSSVEPCRAGYANAESTGDTLHFNYVDDTLELHAALSELSMMQDTFRMIFMLSMRNKETNYTARVVDTLYQIIHPEADVYQGTYDREEDDYFMSRRLNRHRSGYVITVYLSEPSREKMLFRFSGDRIPFDTLQTRFASTYPLKRSQE